jgi:hypothetical protein
VKCEAGEEAAGPVCAGGGVASGKSASKSKKGSGSNKEDVSGKKEYNHHARACFDRAKAFALKVSSCVLGSRLRARQRVRACAGPPAVLSVFLKSMPRAKCVGPHVGQLLYRGADRAKSVAST